MTDVTTISFQRSSETFERETGIKATPEETYTEGSILHEYFPYPPEGYDGPQAFLAHLGPESHAGAHWHPVDQFQMFLGPRDGWFQQEKHLTDILIHYADEYTTYGPFGSYSEPLEYFTLRRRWTDVIRHMPASRDALPKGIARRNRRYHLPPREERQKVSTTPERSEVHQLGMEPDGTAAWHLVAGPHASFDIPHQPGGGGMYIVLLSGQLSFEDETYNGMDLGWVPAGINIDHPASSGEDGLEAVFLQFRS
jgi:hypothetical protein